VEGENPVTTNTSMVSGLWTTSWIVLLIVGLITWGLIIWAVIVYRRRKGQTGLPVQMRYNMPIEIFYTVVPLILVLGFFAFTAKEQASIETPTVNPDVQVEVFAKRWAWDFNYLNVGPAKEGVYSAGVQAVELEKEKSIDFTKLNTLYLPVNKTVEIKLASRDVAHSFWVIDFLYKKDVIPAQTNHMYFIPEKIGTYAGKCAELCGDYHSLMLFEVKVVSQDDYDSYIQSQADKGFVGALDQKYDTNSNQPDNKAPKSNE
jgi:cytochrome c oxidase subunit 2